MNLLTHETFGSIVPSEDAHGSEYVAGATHIGSSFPGRFCGFPVILHCSQYRVQLHWLCWTGHYNEKTLICAGAPGAPQDWIEWLVVCILRFYLLAHFN